MTDRTGYIPSGEVVSSSSSLVYFLNATLALGNYLNNGAKSMARPRARRLAPQRRRRTRTSTGSSTGASSSRPP